MQIDGHHAMTYVAARCAGYDHRDASTIAYSAQYVDDATNSGPITFDIGARYYRISSAHKMVDYRNFRALANHRVWVPFHFLPGNGGLPAGETPPRPSFIHTLRCTPNSHVAQDMLRACFASANTPYFLHRLGISMHIYADTWTHQGFAGVNHPVNQVVDLTSNEPEEDKQLAKKLKKQGWKVRLQNMLLSKAFPLGHGAALSHPDKPYLRWSYTNGLGEKVMRNNADDFCEAIEYMCRALRAFSAGDTDLNLSAHNGLASADADAVRLLVENTRGDGEARHKAWIAAIMSGQFSFSPADLNYIPKGIGSWKHEAIGQEKAVDSRNEIFTFTPAFLCSNWKCFHDALQATRFSIVNDVLPRYGVCVA